MGSKGSKAPSSQTITQSNIPEYAEPYFMAIMDDATGVSSQAYTPYGGQRIADQSTDTTAAYDMTRDIAGSGIPYLGEAMGITQGNIGGAQDIFNAASGAAAYDPYQFRDASGRAQAYSGFENASGLAQPYAGFRDASGRAQAYDGFENASGLAQPYAGFRDASGRAQAYDGFDAYNFGDPQMWESQIASQYMSPYIDNVMNVQKDRAMLDFERMQQYRDADATKAGAFGGSRQAVSDALAQEELSRGMREIDAMGLQGAYDDAGRMFQADRSMGFDFARSQAGEYGRVQESMAQELARTQGIGVDEARRIQESRAQELARTQGIGVDEARRMQESMAQELARTQGIGVDEARRMQESVAQELARTQGIGVDEARRMQESMAQELARVQGISVDEARRVQEAQAAENMGAAQFGMDAYDTSLDALGMSSQFASQLAGMGEAERAAAIQGAQLLEAAGLQQDAYTQAGLDTAYGDFIDQRDWDQDQLSWLSNILRGVPVSPDTTTTQYVPNNPLQDTLGMGISAIGLYNGLNT